MGWQFVAGLAGKLPQRIHRRTAMPRGRRTSYIRDNRGRFASSPGGGGPKRSTPATRRAAMRAGNRLNRDNAGRISGIGRNGATVRGGRLKTAGGNRRATQIASMRPAGFRSGTIAKGGRGVRGSVARSLAAVRAAGGRKAVGLSRARPGQQQRAMQRAQANEKRLQGPAMKGTGLRTRAGVGYAVAKGAQGYYSGSMPRRKATFSPLTGSMDKKALAARRKQVVDNNKPQKGKAAKPAVAAKPTAKKAARGPRVKQSGSPLLRGHLLEQIKAAQASSVPGFTKKLPTAPKRTRSARPAGTVAKPRGMKPGALAARKGVKAKPVRLPKSAAQAVAQANRLLDKLKMQKMKNPGGVGSYQIRDRIDHVNQAIKKIVPGYRHNPTRKGGAAKAAFAEQNRRYGRDARARNNIGRLYG